MGFWLGTLIFAVIEVVGFFTVEAVLGKQYRQDDRRYGKIKNTRYDMNNVDGQLMLVALGIESRLYLSGASRLAQTLVATTVICCWLMWTLVYIGQMYPLVSPLL